MRSWKSALACILFVYLTVASAISLITLYFASASPTLMGQQENSYPQNTPATTPECETARQPGDATALPALPPADAPSIGPGKNSWDFSGPDEIPGLGPPRPCDDYAELMAWALGQ